MNTKDFLFHQKIETLLHNAEMPNWIPALKQQTEEAMEVSKNKDILKWHKAWESLPDTKISSHSFCDNKLTIGDSKDLNETEKEKFKEELKNFMPWRKGPWNYFGVDIDTEWHSDWKWERVSKHIQPLKNRHILDVGCGNGYYSLRMLAQAPKLVIGIDPMQQFVYQFLCAKRYLSPELPCTVLPLGIDDLPTEGNFDTVFSMGVLYHRRSPIDHLTQLSNLLRKDGELVLETLVITGGVNDCLFPSGRYAKMRNVWFIPSVDMLIRWLERIGHKNVRCIDLSPTSVEEQRKTEWMVYDSLEDFLDPDDHSKTIEGYPAPLRATIVSER